jgi:outer membrane protein assembly factor BamB
MARSGKGRHGADLLFVGFNRRIAAMQRSDGQLVWQWKAPHGSGYVALLLDGGTLFASVDGYTYALDPATGELLWTNTLSGLGTGVPCLATMIGTSGGGAAAAELARRSSSSSSPSDHGTAGI